MGFVVQCHHHSLAFGMGWSLPVPLPSVLSPSPYCHCHTGPQGHFNPFQYRSNGLACLLKTCLCGVRETKPVLFGSLNLGSTPARERRGLCPLWPCGWEGFLLSDCQTGSARCWSSPDLSPVFVAGRGAEHPY